MKISFKKYFFLSLFVFALIFFFSKVGIVTAGDCWFGICPPGDTAWDVGSDPVNYLQRVLEAIIGLAGLVAAGFIVFGAYTLITASGEPETIAKGQKMITNAVIGLIIAALAFLIVNFVIVEVPMP